MEEPANALRGSARRDRATLSEEFTSYLARRDHEMGQSGENLGHEGGSSQRAIVLKRIACVRALLQLSRIGL